MKNDTNTENAPIFLKRNLRQTESRIGVKNWDNLKQKRLKK